MLGTWHKHRNTGHVLCVRVNQDFQVSQSLVANSPRARAVEFWNFLWVCVRVCVLSRRLLCMCVHAGACVFVVDDDDDDDDWWTSCTSVCCATACVLLFTQWLFSPSYFDHWAHPGTKPTAPVFDARILILVFKARILILVFKTRTESLLLLKHETGVKRTQQILYCDTYVPRGIFPPPTIDLSL